MILGNFFGIAINTFLEMGKCYAQVFLACLHHLLYIIVNCTPFMKVKMQLQIFAVYYCELHTLTYYILMWCSVLTYIFMVSSIDMSLCFTVPISVVASFRKIREIVYDRSLLVAALRTSSELVNILINIVLTTTFRYHCSWQIPSHFVLYTSLFAYLYFLYLRTQVIRCH
jgi:hypothetical protein